MIENKVIYEISKFKSGLSLLKDSC